MALWLGKPGMLVALPDPAPGVSAPLVRSSAAHTTLGGGRTVDFTGPGRRTWKLRWDRLTHAEYSLIERFHGGAQSPGPFLLLPADTAWNYLSANQASGTDAVGDTTGFTVTRIPPGGPVVQSMPESDTITGERVVYWNVDPAGATVVTLDPMAGLDGLPVIPGGTVSFSVHTRDLSAETPVRLTATIGWLDRFGSPVAASVSQTWESSRLWQRHVLTTVVPTDPRPAWAPAFATITLATAPRADWAVLELDGFAFELGPPGPWLPGRGAPRVSLVELSCDQRWVDYVDAEATLWEVT